MVKGYRRAIFLSIILISLGVLFNTALKETSGSLGIVFIAVGVLFFIIGMSKKRIEMKNDPDANE